MDAAVERRFVELDELIERVRTGNHRFAEATAEAIEQMEVNLTQINQQNVQLAQTYLPR